MYCWNEPLRSAHRAIESCTKKNNPQVMPYQSYLSVEILSHDMYTCNIMYGNTCVKQNPPRYIIISRGARFANPLLHLIQSSSIHSTYLQTWYVT